MDKMLKIAVAGTGYVGLSIATLLAQHHEVCAIDVIPAKVDLINRRKSPIRDEYIEKYLAEKELKLTATLDPAQAYSGADFVVIAAPTNYDSRTQHFDTSAVEAVIQLVMRYNPNAVMVIKSTIPVGYTVSVREKFGSSNIIFSPEFLRESKALYDNLYPSRIIVGTDLNDPRLVEAAHTFAALLQEGAIKENIDTLFMGFTEAEAVKLFAKWNKTSLDKETLEALGIYEFAKKQYYQLSTGQKRRLHLALALTRNPDILFLDEPTAGLDVEGRLSLHEQIRQLKAIGKTIILASHDMTEVENLCDRIAILSGGKIAFIGTVEQLGKTIGKHYNITIQTENGMKKYESENIGDSLLALLMQYKEKGETIVDIQIDRGSLEQHFIKIAKGA